MYLDTTNTRMLIESSSKNFDLPVNVIRYTSPANTRTAVIPRNTNYKLQDKYVVGASKLQVYIDDILLCIGTEYNEIGTAGEESDIIQFIDWDVARDRNLEYVIIGKDYLTISINGEKVAKRDNNIDLPVPTKTSDLINDSGFVTGAGRVANAGTADKVANKLTIKRNNTQVAQFDGSSAVSANITVPTALSELSGYSDVVLSNTSNGGTAVDKVVIMPESTYNSKKASLANGTVVFVY